jgi:hypothetical protein
VGVFNAVIAVMAVPGFVLLIAKFLVLDYLSIYNTYPGADPAAGGRRGRRVRHEAVLRDHPGVGRGGSAHRWRRHAPDLLVGGAADGQAGARSPVVSAG